MKAPDLIVSSSRVVTPEGVRSGSVVVSGGVVVAVEPPGAPHLDSHVHVNDPGRADWEGFETATKAAAAGLRLLHLPGELTPTRRERAVSRSAPPGSV